MSDRLMAVLRIIVLCEIVLGLFLLLREVNDYVSLPTTREIDEMFGGMVVDWYKYKESCYRYLYLYSLITFSGLSFWINKKLYWGLSQMLVITLLFITLIDLYSMHLSNLWFSIVLVIFSLVVFVYIEVRMYSQDIVNSIKISKIARWLSIVGGVMSCGIWWML